MNNEIIEYENLNDETKKYINKAMDIYSTIKDNEIKIEVDNGFYSTKVHQLKKLDKKILSLFIAGFLVEGKLKEIIEEYDDIKLQDLLSFINIEEQEIKKVEDEKYQEFYSKYFQLDLMSLLDSSINIITPEIIVSCLNITENSEILDLFKRKYNIKIAHFRYHPLFEALKNYNLINNKNNNSNRHNKMFPSIFDIKSINHLMLDIDEENTKKETEEEKKSTLIDIEDEKTWSILEEIQKKFIGQEITTEGLFYNIINNQQIAQSKDIPDGQRSIIFLDGPTGTGKTAITREITEKLDIPFTSTSVTNYSSTGYVGGNLTDTLEELYKKANGNLEKAQRGIIVLDEFDKIAYSRNGGLEMKRAVQQQLLDFLGGGKYRIQTGGGFFGLSEVEFDTSKLTFICLGALSDLRTQKTQKKQSIGFGNSSEETEIEEYSITPQDLMSIGLERELVGRFNTFLHTNDYSKEDLMNILKESTISSIISFKKWIESRGKELIIEEEVYELIVNYAYTLNTGARSLQTAMNNIRTHYIKEVLRGKDTIVYLDAQTVQNILDQTTKRKGRR